MKYKNVSGLTEARKILKQFPDRVQKKVMNGAVRSGAAVMRKEIKKAAPVDTDAKSIMSQKYGPLKKNIRVIRLKRGIPKTTAMYRVDTGKAFWGYFLEFGTRFIAPRAWFRPAADSAYEPAVSKIKERISVGIEREALKLAKKFK